MKPTKKNRLVRTLLILALLVAIAVVVKVLFFPPAPPPAPATAEASRGAIENAVLATGTLEAQRLVSVGAQVSGQLRTLHVELGDVVKQGQELAEIDSLTQQNTVRNTEAQLRTVRAQRAAQLASRKQAELQFARQKQLLAIDASSRQEYEAAEATLASVRAQIAALDAEIAQAEIAVDTAKVNLGYTTINAPMDGTVVALIAQEGQTLNANQQAPTILKLARLDTLTVKAQISEADVVRVRPGQTVYFTILGQPDKRYYATLRSVEPAPESIATETSSTASGSSASSSSSAIYYNGLFDVPNPDGTLRISMTAQVNIVLDSAEDAVLVPSAAVRPGPKPGTSTVRVQDAQGAIQTRDVQVGINNNVNAQIVSGLEAGERVVIGPGVRPGAPSAAPRNPPRMRL